MADAKDGNDCFSNVYEQYAQMLFKVAYLFVGNPHDAEDILQDVFMKRLYKAPPFQNADHEKAWLLRVAINASKNILKSRKRFIAFDEATLQGQAQTYDNSTIYEILRLPLKYKAAIHLHYYEGYSVREIAHILQISQSAVKMRLARARDILKFQLGGQNNE